MNFKNILVASALFAATVAAPAAAVQTLTFNFGGGTNNTNAASVARTTSGVTLTATATRFNAFPTLLTNLSQTNAAGATIRVTTPGLGVTGGASTDQMDTNQPGTVGAPLREAILITGSEDFSLKGLQLSFIDNDDTLQIYGVHADGSLVSLGFGGVVIPNRVAPNAALSSLAGAATVSFAAGTNSGQADISFNSVSPYFTRFLFTTRERGDVNYLGTLGQGYRLNQIVANVPEPETWALLIIGFGLVGFTARRRKGVVAA